MAYENVQFPCKNFCIFPIVGNFCSIDYDNSLMQVKNSSGDLIKIYNLDNSVNEIVSIEYVGPRDVGVSLSQLGECLPFFSLDRDDDVYFIREWRLNASNSQLELYNTISGSVNDIDCYDMSVEYYSTEFADATVTGTGRIKIDDYSNISIGDQLLLGPSSDMDNQYAFEWAEVTTVSGEWVYITSEGVTPPHYEYDDGDKITYYKDIFLFSDNDQYGNTTKGSLYRIDSSDGSILNVEDSGIYSGVRASAWSSVYQCIGMVNGSNLLYIDPGNEYDVQKSHVLTNIESDYVTTIPVYDLIFDSNTIYRLQQKITLKDDDGDRSTTDWSPYYNYHQDTIAPYTSSISLSVDPDGVVLNDDQVTITAVVRDQYGVGLLSKLLYFTKTGGDMGGSFDPINGQVYTNASGIATIIYNTGDYDLGGTNSEIDIKAKTDGSSTLTGSSYVWDNVSLFLYSNFTINLINFTQKPTLSGVWPTYGSDLYNQIYMTQISGMESEFNVKQLNKFQFPGGPWSINSAPNDNTTVIRQLLDREDKLKLDQLVNPFEKVVYAFQDEGQSNDLQISQTYVSRHLSSGHQDDVDIDQFRFVEDAIPAFWSEKNSKDTDIWIRLRPFAYDLNGSTLIFRVREISYAGDTGYVNVTSSCVVTPFDAGGSLQGLDILYNPNNDFHHNAVVYVSIEVYDNAPVPNIILTDYWFRIIPDYTTPYITNEDPSREEEDVVVNTNISFDIIDVGVGVDIDTLEFYVNARKVNTYSVSNISGGYHVSYNPSNNFYYGENVEVTVKVKDASDNENMLYDMWRFYVIGSTGPWIDRGSFNPKNCSYGVYRKQTGIYFNVYSIDDTGVDRESILVTIGGKERQVVITPIIYRQE